LLAVFAFSLVRGANQHHFEFRRDYELLSEGQATGWTNFPPEAVASLKHNELIIHTNGIDIANPVILEKLRKGRVHGTLVYPNAFAGAILLLLPAAFACVFAGTRELRPWLRWLVIALTTSLGLGCLYWTGSKSGWLIAIGMIALGVMIRAPVSNRIKIAIASAILLGGLTVFGVRFQKYFASGATSVSARFDYWKAAAQVIQEQPIFGSGPGTFQRPYARLKAPESEMARLTHNDYLQQASDSGLPGAFTYILWTLGALILAARKAKSPIAFACFLGVSGWFAQGLSEFSLYIPALAWPAFTLLGILVGLPVSASTSSAIPPNSTTGTRSQN
jgi:O-antigen ligase